MVLVLRPNNIHHSVLWNLLRLGLEFSFFFLVNWLMCQPWRVSPQIDSLPIPALHHRRLNFPGSCVGWPVWGWSMGTGWWRRKGEAMVFLCPSLYPQVLLWWRLLLGLHGSVPSGQAHYKFQLPQGDQASGFCTIPPFLCDPPFQGW